MKKLAALIVVGLLWATCASAAVTFDANATADCTSNAVTTKDCATLTVGAGANRALVCQVGWSGAVTSPTLVWDQGGTNQSMTAITGATATNTVVSQLWGLVAPTSGAKTLRATWTTARDIVVNCTSYTGVDQTGGATSFPHGTGATGTGNGVSQTLVTVTSAVNNAAVAVMATTGTPSAPTQTQTFLDSSPASESAAGARAAGAASVAFGWTVTSPIGWAAAGTDILASGAGAACTPTLTLLGVGRCG